MSKKLFLFTALAITVACGCTKLDETLEGNLTSGQLPQENTAELLRGVYASLEGNFTIPWKLFSLSDFATDEALAPTRGPDWDDNGAWRVFHQHQWDAANSHIHDCFNDFCTTIFYATDMLQYNPTAQEQAEARLLRAWAMFWLLDFFDQVPYRDPGEDVSHPARVRKGLEALDYIISEVNSAEADLPDGPPNVANKYAAKVFLMKCYLNKAVYANRVNPVFDPADMNKVIALADEVIESNQFSFSANYFDNFSTNNADVHVGKENIFAQACFGGGLAFAWKGDTHYKQHGGYNGFATLSDFYDKFEAGDKRREAVYDYPNGPANPGRRVNVGFLIDQQYDLDIDTLLTDRFGNLLIFTPEVRNIETGVDLETTGIRPIKYAPDYANYDQWTVPSNNFVYFRLPDVLLMKAEAILRGGTPTSGVQYGDDPLTIVNSIRTDPSRGASRLSSIDLNGLLDERGRELWWENWRRQDMIRFGTFLKPFQQKDYVSDPKYLLFPIPYDQLGIDPNLEQNPGY